MFAQKSLFTDQAPTLDEVMSAWDAHRAQWLSRAMIAQCLGRSKSPALIAVINVALGMGYLEIKNEILPNGASYYLYMPTARWYADAPPF
jgi:hypothetical protein